ncbi:MAG: HDOD domain-containing protein [Dehalococcoidia bacterium]|nr:HDOD domain-containing protein [Dehalococcoidia bacterium]
MPSVDDLARDAASRYPLPPVLYRLLGLNEPGVEDAPQAGTALAEVVSRDPDLVRRLRMVASADAPWRARTERRSLEQGVRDLGFRRIHTGALVISTIVGLPVKTTALDYLRFWRYSVAAAFLTQSVGYYRRVDWVEFGTAVGLYHDVGRLLIEDIDPVGMQRVRQRQLAGEGQWLQLEREELGFTAFDLTVALLKAWKFPDPMVEAIASVTTQDPPGLTVALRDSVLTARALDFATKAGRRHEVVPDVLYILDRYFSGVEGLTQRVDGLLGSAMISIPEDTGAA